MSHPKYLVLALKWIFKGLAVIALFVAYKMFL